MPKLQNDAMRSLDAFLGKTSPQVEAAREAFAVAPAGSVLGRVVLMEVTADYGRYTEQEEGWLRRRTGLSERSDAVGHRLLG